MRKVVVISVDSLVSEDLEYLGKNPCLSRALSSGKIFRDILCVYPTLTYPCHATILTGKRPGEHGIIHNERFCTGKKMDWMGKSSCIRTKTILDVASANGLVTASVSWPVTNSAKVDYLIGEIWPPAEGNAEEAYRVVNSPQGHKVFSRHLWDGCTFMNKDIDRLTMECSLDIITNFRPDLMLLHLAELDCSRHNNGVDPEKNLAAISHIGDSLELIWNTLSSVYGEEGFYMVILGDHGQLDRDHSFSIHKVLEDKGLCKFSKDGVLEDYTLYFHSTGLSALVYTKGMERETALGIIHEIKKEYPKEIGEVFTKEEAKEKFGLFGDFDFVVEAGDGTYLEKSPSLPLVKAIKKDSFMSASHGHLPHKGMKPPFVVCGPVENVNKEEVAHLEDEARYIMSLLGLTI